MASGVGGAGGGGAPSLVSDATPVQVCSGRGGGADSFGALSRCQPGCGLVWESNLGRIERVTGDNVRQPQRLQIISMMSDLSGRLTVLGESGDWTAAFLFPLSER